jgi:hypothetical protein
MLHPTLTTAPARRALATTATALVLGATALASTGCGLLGTDITADTSCRDYLNAPSEIRHDAAIRISADVSPSSPGNPLWAFNTDASCGSDPEQTVGEALGG